VTLPSGNRILIVSRGHPLNLAAGTGRSSFIMSMSFCNQLLAQLELWKNDGKYKASVNKLPRSIDEQVARLHLDKLGVQLTSLTDAQAKYLGVTLHTGPKPDGQRA
jgi:adenosylhomocysteinase